MTSAIVGYLEKFADMTPAMQQAVLVTAGMALQTRTGMDCNILGGALACRPVPANSSYIQQCGADAQPKVDCLFREPVEANVYDSPVDNLEAYLKQKLGAGSAKGFEDAPALCPQCFDRVQALWCALAVPSCGTFDLLVKKGILPALSQAVKEYRASSSDTRTEALAGAVASVLQASGAGLPCAVMCESALDTCAGQCGSAPKQATLGELVQWMASKPEIQHIGRTPNLKNARAIFKDLWDRPVCSLFPHSSNAGGGQQGSGACRLPPTPLKCKSQQRWCDALSAAGSNDSPIMYVQALILVQLLRASTGWLTNDDAIIWDIHSSVSDAVSASTGTTKNFNEMDSGGGSKSMPAGRVAGIVMLSLFAFGLLAVGIAMATLQWWHGRGSKQVFCQELSDQDAESEAYPLNPWGRL